MRHVTPKSIEIERARAWLQEGHMVVGSQSWEEPVSGSTSTSWFVPCWC